MICRPYVLRWMNGLCYWLRLSKDGRTIVRQSASGFFSEEQAKADFMWWNATS